MTADGSVVYTVLTEDRTILYRGTPDGFVPGENFTTAVKPDRYYPVTEIDGFLGILTGTEPAAEPADAEPDGVFYGVRGNRNGIADAQKWFAYDFGTVPHLEYSQEGDGEPALSILYRHGGIWYAAPASSAGAPAYNRPLTGLPDRAALLACGGRINPRLYFSAEGGGPYIDEYAFSGDAWTSLGRIEIPGKILDQGLRFDRAAGERAAFGLNSIALIPAERGTVFYDSGHRAFQFIPNIIYSVSRIVNGRSFLVAYTGDAIALYRVEE
jgi:hypothetical protein